MKKRRKNNDLNEIKKVKTRKILEIMKKWKTTKKMKKIRITTKKLYVEQKEILRKRRRAGSEESERYNKI